MSGRPWAAEVLQEFIGKVAQQDAAQAAKASWLALQMRELEADRDAWQRRAKESERDRDSWQTHANNVRDHAEKADGEVDRLQTEVARLQRMVYANGSGALGVELDLLRLQVPELRALATEAEKRAEKAEAALFQANCERADAEVEAARLRRELDLLRPTNPPPQPGTGDVWQEIIDSLSPNHPMRAACIKRRELGIARYGHPLQYGNGRNGDQDLEEELLDAAAFAWLRGLRSFSGYLINAAFDPWWALRAEHSADLNAKASLLEQRSALLAEAHASLVDLLTLGDDAPAASWAAKVADAIARGDR